MAVYTAEIQKLYVAYFNRPADYEGLAHWERVLTANNGNINAVSAFFAQSGEYRDQNVGKSYFQIVNQIYNNLFNRDADVSGLEFWAGKLRAGTFTVDQIVKVIADNASDTDAKDKTTYANKVAAATAFTAELNTASEIIGYSGNTANQAAKNWLSTVGGTPESLAAAIAPAALASTVNAVAQTGLSTGAPMVLTTSIDTLNGTSGNDTFVGLINNVGGATGDLTTLTALDSIVGGSGVDTLQINALTAINGIPSISVSGVEVVTVRAASSVDANISAWTGVEQFNLTEATGNVKMAAGATTNIAATLKANGTATTIIDGGKDVVVRVSDVNAGSQTINVGGTTAAKGVVSVESTGAAAVAGTPITLGDITVKGGTTINVTQNATSSVTGLTVGTTTHTLGDITITGDASTSTVNVKQTAAADAVAGVATVAAVRETASVKFSAMTAGQTLTVAGLTFTASKALTAAEVATAFSNLINGSLPVAADTQGSGIAANGIYTGNTAGWTSGAANGDTVVFTSISSGNVTNIAFGGTATAPVATTTEGVAAAGEAAVAGVVAGTVSLNDAASTIKTVSIDSYGAGSAITGAASQLSSISLANSMEDIAITSTAATVALTLNAIGDSTADAAVSFGTAPATLNVKSTGNNFIDLTAAATETLNVSGTGTLKADMIGASALKTIVVTETAGLNTGSAASAVLANVTSVNTTATTGTVTVAIDGDKATYTGGAGADRVTVTGAAISKSISLGAGNDRLDLTAMDATKLGAIGASITMDGGEGTADTLVLNAAAAATVSATAAFEAKISNFERLEVGQLSANATVNLDNLDDINYVISKGSVPTSVGAPTTPSVNTTQGVNAVPGVTERASVTFAGIADTQSITVGGRTVTATGGALTAAEVAAAFATGGNAGNAVVSGSLVGYTAAAGTGNEVVFTSSTANSNVSDISVSSVGAATPAPVITQGSTGTPASTESTVVTFGALTNGQSFTVGGLTVTAGAAGASAADVAAVFGSGVGTAALSVSGTLTGFTAGSVTGSNVTFTSTTAGSVTDISVAANGASLPNVLTLDKMLANATVQLDAAGGVVVKLADVSGTADIVNLIANGGNNVNLGTTTVAGVETINITANDTVAGSGVSTNTLTLAADAAKTVKVSGAGHFTLNLDAATKVVTAIDASAATGNVRIASSTAADAVAVTITGGSGNDVLTASGNKADVLIGGAGNDTLVSGTGLATLTGGAGNDLFRIGSASQNVNSYATITDFSGGDLIQFVGATSFTSAKVALGETAVFQDYANAAVNAMTAGQVGWFQLGGNTYIVADMGANSTNGFVNGEDFIVKLTGTIDLTNASFNAQYGTIGLV